MARKFLSGLSIALVLGVSLALIGVRRRREEQQAGDLLLVDGRW